MRVPERERMTMATKARSGGPPEAPPGRPGGTGLSEADIPTPPAGVFAQPTPGAPPTPGVGNEQSALVVDETSYERNGQEEQDPSVPDRPVPDRPAGPPVTRQVMASAPSVPPSGPQPPAPAPDAGPDEWEEVGTAAWDPAVVWDAEDKNELWVKGLGWGAPPETSRWESQDPSVSGPAVRVGWSAAGWSSAPPLVPSDEADPGRARDEAALAFTDDFTVTHRRVADGGDDDARSDRDRADPDDRQDGERQDEAPSPARRSLPWRELVIVSAVAVIAAAVVLGVTSAKVNLTNTGAATSSPTLTSANASGLGTGSGAKLLAPPRHTTSTVRTTSASTAATTAPLVDQRAKALPVTPGVEDSLIKSWVATNPGGYGFSLGDVAGTVPSKVFYAVQPGTGTYWAVAAFKPSPALQAQSSTTTGNAELSEFKNSLYAFSWQAGPLWTLLGEVSTGDCPGIWVPRSVLAAWSLCGL